MSSTMTPMEIFSAADRSEGARSRRLSTGPVLAVAIVSVALGARFFLIIWKYSINLLFYDQWQYLTPFFHHQPTLAELFFWQHGPVREGVGLFADKFLYPLTHWNVRVDSFIVGAGIFAAMLLALRLKYELFGTISYSDVSIPLIFLTLQQCETVIGTPNPAYSGLPLLMIMLYCFALLGRNRLLKYCLVLALNFLLIYTGFGLFMGVVTLGVFLLECYGSWRRTTSVPFGQALTGLIVAAASLASFFVHYALWPAVDCFEIPHGHLLQYLRFTALMFSGFVAPRPLHVSWGMTVLGVGILSVAGAVLAWHLLRLLKGPSRGADLIGAVLVSYCLLFSVNAGIGRLCVSLQLAYSTRYVTLLIPGFLALYFYLLSKSWYGKRNLVLTLWVLLLLPAAVRKPWEEVRWYSNGKRDWANCYVRTENIHYCDQIANFVVYPPPEQPDFQRKLDYLKQNQLNLFHEPNSK